METTLYADILLLMNFSMDFISLWAASLLCSARRSAWRMSLGASIGAFGALFCTVMCFNTTVSYIAAALLSILMCLAAFGYDSGRRLINRSISVWICGALLSGIMTAFLSLFGTSYTLSGVKVTTKPFFAVCITGAAAYFVMKFIKRSKSKKTTTVTLQKDNKSVTFQALCDSGNLLRDPISGTPVAVVSFETLVPLFPKEILNAMLSFDTELLEHQKIPIRIVPRKTTDKSVISCATTVDSFLVGDKGERHTVQCLILPINCKKDYFGGFPASVPTDIL